MIIKKKTKKNKIQFSSSTNGEKKRGRIPKKKGQKIQTHTKTAFDKLQRKIQVNFISFIINVSNDALRLCYGKKMFVFIQRYPI